MELLNFILHNATMQIHFYQVDHVLFECFYHYIAVFLRTPFDIKWSVLQERIDK